MGVFGKRRQAHSARGLLCQRHGLELKKTLIGPGPQCGQWLPDRLCRMRTARRGIKGPAVQARRSLKPECAVSVAWPSRSGESGQDDQYPLTAVAVFSVPDERNSRTDIPAATNASQRR
jgi:hypothetical protein